MSISRLVDKQNAIHTNNGILFSLKKEGNSDTCCNMDETWGHYAKRSQSQKDVHILYDSTSMGYLEKSNPQKLKAEWWLPGAGVKGKWELFKEYRISAFQMKFWRLVAPQCVYTWCYWTVQLKIKDGKKNFLRPFYMPGIIVHCRDTGTWKNPFTRDHYILVGVNIYNF